MTDLSPEMLELLAEAARAGADKAIEFLQGGRLIPGTVAAYGAGEAQVRIDGASGESQIPCGNLVGRELIPGERVYVIFNPPHKHHVAFVAAPLCPGGRIYSGSEPGG